LIRQVDVGTSSVRAGLVVKSENGGKLLRYHSAEIEIFNPQKDFFEQSSDNIWQKVCECIREVSADVPKTEIKGIGFDATCSLVIFDKNFQPISVSPTKNQTQNIIMWLDHRAQKEASFINSFQHDVLKYVGGKVSLEMEIPKLLWLKRNMPESFKKIELAFDLPDFLTWRATGIDFRSICSLNCKWNYDAIKSEWPKDYFQEIGLDDLMMNNAQKIGSKVLFPGDRVGGLSKVSAQEMGLEEGTAVAVSMIDAHAGALGLIGSSSESTAGLDITSKLIIIAGTSSCHMSVSDHCLYSPSIWGPYLHALLPNYYLSEAGQSASGLLIDFLLKSHPDYEKISSSLRSDENIHDRLFDDILKLAAVENVDFWELTKDFHIYPDFHGNRSPIGDNSLRGAKVGLSMHDSILIWYLAVIQSLAYQTKHIIESLYTSGRAKFETILICGGLSKNKLFIQSHADICQLMVQTSHEVESVLIGASMLGAAASGVYPEGLLSAVSDLANSCSEIIPRKQSSEFHSRKFKVFLKMLDDQRSYAKIMND
jgi:FGGY-family pentulose kinase